MTCDNPQPSTHLNPVHDDTMLMHVLFFVLGSPPCRRRRVAGARRLEDRPVARDFAAVVGLTIVAMGTSSPEVAVSVGAALSGNTDIRARQRRPAATSSTCCSSSVSAR